ncbi:proline racemase family protein [Rhizobium jaguaris]|uniref:proline racemase family protein n=1 Tax=Rhizobium jaguaris TaxID=1312183 RepID=UPI001FDEE378|nr:proline racemase family protein [Rhizobium jaguaris]
MMSGAMLVPSTREDCDTGVLYLETSGCLPMCGHATIGLVTFIIEKGLIEPATPGLVRLDTPAGVVEAKYEKTGDKSPAFDSATSPLSSLPKVSSWTIPISDPSSSTSPMAEISIPSSRASRISAIVQITH